MPRLPTRRRLGAAHLPGMLAAHTRLPVLGVPIESQALKGMDSLLSIVQMPGGVPVGTLAIGKPGAKNAGLMAAQILALADDAVAVRLEAWRRAQTILGDETARARNPSRCDFASPAKGRRAANAGVARLKGRLLGLSLDMTVIAGDGNCLFRSCSHQLFGSEAHHEFIRTSTVDYMRDHASDFKAFFAGSLFDRYLTRMRRDRTWGDELTLRGICNCFGCHIHVVTSLEHNWYLKYSPVHARTQKHVFLAYISPAHYNSIVLASGALDASEQRQSGGAGTERTRRRAGDSQKRRVGELDGSNAGRRVSSRRSK